MTSPFELVTDADLEDLIRQAPLCWIVPHADPANAILMPVILEAGPDGRPCSLLGHLPKRAPATAVLDRDGSASFLFLGANAYVDPSMAGKSDWGPTWNFVSASISGNVRIDEGLTMEAVSALVALLEGPDGWRISQLGPRYAELAASIIGYRADISDVRPRFKLGQDETVGVRSAILAALKGTPIGEWLQRFDGGASAGERGSPGS